MKKNPPWKRVPAPKKGPFLDPLRGQKVGFLDVFFGIRDQKIIQKISF